MSCVQRLQPLLLHLLGAVAFEQPVKVRRRRAVSCDLGFEVTAFDKCDGVGGNWRFNDATGHSSVFETTHIISSKEFSGYDDYPMCVRVGGGRLWVSTRDYQTGLLGYDLPVAAGQLPDIEMTGVAGPTDQVTGRRLGRAARRRGVRSLRTRGWGTDRSSSAVPDAW